MASTHSRTTMSRAQPRPSVASARSCFGVEHAAPALGVDVAAEIAVVAEQAEPVHHLPGDDDAGRRLGRRRGDLGQRRFRGLGATGAMGAGKENEDRRNGGGKETDG